MFATVDRDAAEFGPLQTNPPFRDRGYGTRVLIELERIVGESGVEIMKAEFKPDTGQEYTVRRFYEKRGYTIEGNEIRKKLK